MTSVDARTRSTTDSSGWSSDVTPVAARARRAVPLVVGAALLLLLLEPVGNLPLRGWVPVITGLSFVAGGLLSDRKGLMVAPGLVIAIWGIAPMTVQYTGEEFNGMFYLCLGTGLLAAALLARAGWRIAPMSLAIPVLFIGGVMAIAPHVGSWLTTILAVLLVAYAGYQMRPTTGADAATAGHRA